MKKVALYVIYRVTFNYLYFITLVKIFIKLQPILDFFYLISRNGVIKYGKYINNNKRYENNKKIDKRDYSK